MCFDVGAFWVAWVCDLDVCGWGISGFPGCLALLLVLVVVLPTTFVSGLVGVFLVGKLLWCWGLGGFGAFWVFSCGFCFCVGLV